MVKDKCLAVGRQPLTLRFGDLKLVGFTQMEVSFTKNGLNLRYKFIETLASYEFQTYTNWTVS